MILEIATIQVKAGKEDAFETGVHAAAAVFAQAEGCVSMALWRGIEAPGTYRLMVTWKHLEDHTETFRNSPLFAQWRALVGEFFAASPSVEHVRPILTPSDGA